MFNLPAAIISALAFLVPLEGVEISLAFILEVHADNMFSIFVF